jgi:hypothetical protein
MEGISKGITAIGQAIETAAAWLRGIGSSIAEGARGFARAVRNFEVWVIEGWEGITTGVSKWWEGLWG